MSVIKLKKDQEVFKGGLLVENPVYKPDFLLTIHL